MRSRLLPGIFVVLVAVLAASYLATRRRASAIEASDSVSGQFVEFGFDQPEHCANRYGRHDRPRWRQRGRDD
jgi:hypothetical protein